MKILAIQNRMGIGDTIIFLPFIEALAKKFETQVYLLVKENSKYVNNGTKPGDITFNLYQHVDDHITEYYCLPETGDFFIFPSKLIHSVNTFKSKGERVSVATNFVIE